MLLLTNQGGSRSSGAQFCAGLVRVDIVLILIVVQAIVCDLCTCVPGIAGLCIFCALVSGRY